LLVRDNSTFAIYFPETTTTYLERGKFSTHGLGRTSRGARTSRRLFHLNTRARLCESGDSKPSALRLTATCVTTTAIAARRTGLPVLRLTKHHQVRSRHRVAPRPLRRAHRFPARPCRRRHLKFRRSPRGAPASPARPPLPSAASAIAAIPVAFSLLLTSRYTSSLYADPVGAPPSKQRRSTQPEPL